MQAAIVLDDVGDDDVNNRGVVMTAVLAKAKRPAV
jgi:hypothetical protein